jgi:hypothetical protein
MIISTWILVATVSGSSPTYPTRNIIIPDMPDKAECQRVGEELDKRFDFKKALCIEIRKVK